MKAILHSFLTITIALLLSSCMAATSYKRIASRHADRSYGGSVVSWDGGLGKQYFLIKGFEEDGYLVLCGSYTDGPSSFTEKGGRERADLSTIYIGDKKIVSSSFMRGKAITGFKSMASTTTDEYLSKVMEMEVDCIKTEIKYEPQFSYERIYIRGPKHLTVFD